MIREILEGNFDPTDEDMGNNEAFAYDNNISNFGSTLRATSPDHTPPNKSPATSPRNGSSQDHFGGGDSIDAGQSVYDANVWLSPGARKEQKRYARSSGHHQHTLSSNRLLRGSTTRKLVGPGIGGAGGIGGGTSSNINNSESGRKKGKDVRRSFV